MSHDESYIIFQGRCYCNGHASDCKLDSRGNNVECMCDHNTTGNDCQDCPDLFSKNDWRAGMTHHYDSLSTMTRIASYRYNLANECAKRELTSNSGDRVSRWGDQCNCNGHSDRCGGINHLL